MSTFLDGAVMAYRDAADFTKKLAETLPPEVQFVRPAFEQIAEGLYNKANAALAENQRLKEHPNDPRRAS